MFTETNEVKGEQGREGGSMKEAPPACSALNVFLARAAIKLADKLYSVYGDVWFSPKEKAHTRCLRLASALLNLSKSRPDIIQRVSMEQDRVQHLEQHLLDPDDGDTGSVPKQDVADSVRNLEQLIRGPDGGDTGKVMKNEAVQDQITSANPSTYPSNCSLEDHISLTMDPNQQADTEIQRVSVKQDCVRHLEQHLPDPDDGDTGSVPEQDLDDFIRQLLLDPDGGDTGNEPENEEVQAPVTSANPNTYPSNCSLEDNSLMMDRNLQAAMEQRLEVDSGDTGNVSKENDCSTPQIHTSPSNPSNVAVNQQNEVMTMTRTPTAVAANNAIPLMHQVEKPKSVSDVPMHQPHPIMHQFNSQLHHHSSNPTVQLSPQVPSSVPVVHTPLPVNHFNQQQIITPPTIPTASMPMTAGLVPHRTLSDHMSQAMTRFPQIRSSCPLLFNSSKPSCSSSSCNTSI